MAIATTSLRSNAKSEARSQAGFYMGRALMAQGKMQDAAKLFTVAAGYRDTFYGLLAAGQVGAKDTYAQLATVAANYPKLDVKYIDPRTTPELVNAIIKPESNFVVTAVSPAGALGLMQLMPGTAAATARSAGVNVDLRTVAYNPTVNVAIGSRYFGDLLTRYSNNIMLAAAGYNAGPVRVDNWLGRFGDPRGGQSVDPTDWVELIPIKETRNYVKRVVSSYVTYSTLASK
jgi:soluble lytic murein transglycosylase-like protein